MFIVGDVFVVHGFDDMTLIAMWDMFTGDSEGDNSTIIGQFVDLLRIEI